MPPEIEPTDEAFVPYRLLKSERTAVGDLILICSELDHLVSVALFKTAEIHGDIGFSLMGRTTVGTRLTKLRAVLKAESPTKSAAFAQHTHIFDRILRTRNAFAHGQFVGLLNDCLCYLVTADPATDDDNIIFKVEQVHRSELSPLISSARQLSIEMQTLFDISGLHTAIPHKLARRKPRDRR